MACEATCDELESVKHHVALRVGQLSHADNELWAHVGRLADFEQQLVLQVDMLERKVQRLVEDVNRFVFLTTRFLSVLIFVEVFRALVALLH
jgi:hypothetical protein